eukprot:CAMPEP_0202695166 /NCGR_PEP_ID=MMETSP1385-20130828/8824_1 /ASSEMBLY_ACC=CAM_ASM_000861 /TAXON_ID=933848 /ORGANISM="Elphidium margaritaceum" /LENGTH=722 /DNA_ID=CAMNT_0049351141 /DNA_START=68 /DNA_END=2236 /DNA_ORIENTATION=+
MGAIETAQKLSERVMAGKAKLDADIKRDYARYQYLKRHSKKTLNAMLESVAASFETCSAFSESTLLIAYMYDPEKCSEIILRACRKVLTAPINKHEFAWFEQSVFGSSVWFFNCPKSDDRYLFEDLLGIAKTIASDVVESMDDIYDDLTRHKQWQQMQAIKNETLIARQDHKRVGLLHNKGIRAVLESKSRDDGADELEANDFRAFIDQHLALNTLISTAAKINGEFQQHMQMVMSPFGDFKEAPIKSLQRSQTKMERSEYQEQALPKSAALCDLVRCSVTFNTVHQFLVGYQALMHHMDKHQDLMELARVKNGFINTDDHKNGYRDIKVYVVYKSMNPEHENVKMICEVQLLLINYLQEKKRVHQIWDILREETYLRMVPKTQLGGGSSHGSSSGGNTVKDLSQLKFTELLRVGREVRLDYKDRDMYHCSVDSDTGLLGMEGWGWFGVVDLSRKMMIVSMKREQQIYYTHRWLTFHEHRYLSVQTRRNQVEMWRVVCDKRGGYNFVNDAHYKCVVNGTIDYVQFDRSYAHMLLVVNESAIQVRAMSHLGAATKTIKLQEKIATSAMRNVRFSGDGTRCVLGGGEGCAYFYLVDIVSEKVHKLSSSFLQSTLAPCFINGDCQRVAVCGEAGKIEIWDVEQRQSVKCIQSDSQRDMTSSTSTDNILAVGSDDKRLRLYNVGNWECFFMKQFNFGGCALHLTEDMRYVTFAGYGGDRCAVLKID